MSNAHEPFDRMSAQIQSNVGTSFGGACVVVFPTANNTMTLESIELMMLDSKGDIAQFLATLITRLKMVQEEIEAKSRMPGFGR